MFLQLLKYAINIATVITGVVSLFWPLKVQEFTGLTVNGGRGTTEVRTILGALFIGLGVAAQIYNQKQTYAMLGIMYLAMALVRGVSIIVDKSAVSSNIISFATELIFGLILML
ncbi:MAG TPA: hypothetical protein VMW34_11685 [Anaerolineales bacterium]|nr:hypothetical protein [Anaerolineales bacterium]